MTHNCSNIKYFIINLENIHVCFGSKMEKKKQQHKMICNFVVVGWLQIVF